jgi:AMP-binding enzyme
VLIAIHRAVEHQVAVRGELPAYIDEKRTLSYRELNSRANALARALMASGFKRGSVAAVRMRASAEVVITLLAVLKAGGAYTRIDDDDSSWPCGLSIVEKCADGEGRCVAVDSTRMLSEELTPSPNLPILTRGSDIACVLRDHDGSPAVLVPHSTITTLPLAQVPPTVTWSGERDAPDLWLALMTGSTVIVVAAAVESAAA